MGKLKNTFIAILMGLSVIGAVRNSWGAPPVIPPTPTPGVTASDVVCTECVNDTDIAAGAVTEPKLAPGAVTNGKIADGAVTDAKITGPISAAKIEQGTGSGLNADLLDGLDSREFSKKPANIVVVAKSGGDFTSIQSAIDSINPTADNPYLIKVMPGVYPEFLILKSNIYLDGTAPSLTTISVSGLNVGYVISANGVSNTVVANFTIKCDRSYGIYPFYSSLSLIGNIITGCGVGIISDHSDTTVIENTIIGGNIGIEAIKGSLMIKRNKISGTGVGITRGPELPDYLHIEDNTVSTSGTGIYMDARSGNIIRNTVTGNQRDILVDHNYIYSTYNISFNVYDIGPTGIGSYNVRSDGTPMQ